MMNAREKEALMRTHEHLVRHLEDLNDEIDHNGGRINDHMVLDGIKDSVKTLCRLDGMLDVDGKPTEEDLTAANASSFMKVKAPSVV